MIVVAAFAIGGLDPYLNLVTTMSGLSTIGIVLLEATAAVAIIAYFRTRSDRHWWCTLVAPLVGLAGLVTATVLILKNFPTLTCTHSTFVNALPYIVIAAALAVAVYIAWLRSHQTRALRADWQRRGVRPACRERADSGYRREDDQ